MLNFFSRWFSKSNKLSPKSKKKTLRPAAFLRHPQVELLEDRITPASFTYNGGTAALAIVLNNNNENLLLTSQGNGNYTFYSSDNFTGFDFPGYITGNGTTTLTISNFLDLANIDFTDQSGIAGTSILFGTSTGAYADNITITLDNSGSSLVTIGAATSFSGDASLNVAAVRNINVNAPISTVNGNITLDANSGFQQAGDFIGVDISANVTTTGNGSITIEGRGGDNINGNQIGVSINSGAQVKVGGTGTVSLFGRGGWCIASGGDYNYGVYIYGKGSGITSLSGKVNIEGLGGKSDYGSDHNYGVYVSNSGFILGGGPVVVTGTGGSGESGYDIGVNVNGGTITSLSGDVSVDGTGGQEESPSSYGVLVTGGGVISAGGSGNLKVTGAGGYSNGDSNFGVFVNNPGSCISTSGGDLTVTGTGGGGPASNGNYGVFVNDYGVISAGENGAVTVNGNGGDFGSGSFNIGIVIQQAGTISSEDTLTLNGIGGEGTANLGLAFLGGTISTATKNTPLSITADTLDLGTSTITAGTGTVTLQNSTAGKAINLGTASTTSFGLSDAQLDRITAGNLVIGRDDANATGLITVSSALTITPNLTLKGNGFAANANLTVPGSLALTSAASVSGAGLVTAAQLGISAKTGIQLNTAVGTFASIANSTSGDITINQTGGISLPAISAPGNLSISATKGIVVAKSISAAGNILLDADTDTQQTGNFIGVAIGADITTTNNGNITIEGRGGNDAFGGQDGVEITVLTAQGTLVKSGGTGKVAITGVAGSSSGNINIGVDIRGQDGFNPLVTSSGGEVVINGTGGDAGSIFNVGVAVLDGGSVQSGGTAPVSIQGKGGGTGAGASNNDGILVENKGQISSLGALNVSGIQGGGIDSYALYLGESAKVSANNASLLISADSLWIDITSGNEAIVTAGTGTVTIQNRTAGITFSLGGSGASINLNQPQLNQITAGTLVIGRDDNTNLAGAITISGPISRTGSLTLLGRNIAVNKGLTVAGNLVLDADNGTQQTGNFIGVAIGADITTTNNGNITIEGRGGKGDFDRQHGVSLSGHTVQAGGTGKVTITGRGGLGDKGINEGVHLEAAIEAGVVVYARITSAGGDVSVTGTGGSSPIAEQSIFNTGVSLYTGSVIDAGLNGKVQVTGTGVGSDGYNFGVYLADDSKLKTAGGPLLVIAQGGGGFYGDGLHMEEGGGLDTSSGNGSITVQAVAGAGADSFPLTGLTIIKGSNPVAINSGTGNLTLVVDQISTGLSNLQLLTTGVLTLQPVSNSFATPVSLSSLSSNFILNPAPGNGFNSLAGLVIGKSTNTSAVQLDLAIAPLGPVSVFAGGGITVSKTLSANGNILLDADTGSQVSGNFIGVNISADVTTTNNGNITIEGRGGDDVSGSQPGIKISGGADVLPNGTGTVVITGIGGASAGDGNDGVYIVGAGTKVSSNGGSIVITGAGGGTGDSSFSSGISVDGALVQSGGSGAVSVNGVGGGGVGENSDVNSGVLVYGQGEIKSQGTLAVTGTAGTGGFSTGVGLGAFFGSGKDSGTLSTSNATLTITTNNLFLGNVSGQEGFINAGSGTVTLRNKTAGTAINLGAIAAGVSLTQAQLNRITAGTLVVGRNDAGVETGTITIGAALTLTPSLQLVGPNGITFKNDVTTIGSQAYIGAITMAGNAALAAGGDLAFSSTVNGAFSLSTSSVGATTATGDIGDSAPLTSLIISKSAGANFAGSVATATSVVIQDTTVSKAIAFQGALITPTLTVNAGTAAFDVALNGTGTSITNAVQFNNTGSVSLGNQADDIILFQGGFNSTASSKTVLAGSIRSSGNSMTLDGVSLTANASLDTTNNGANPAGAVINLIDGAVLNGFTLTLNSGATTNTVTGNVAITGGSLISISDLSIGTAVTPATVTASESTVIQSQGTLVVQTGSKIDSGTFPLTLRADTLSILSGPGSVIASKVTVAPATADRAIFLGDATGTGLVVNQAAFEAMKTDQLTIGGDGYKGNIQMGVLSLGTSLEIKADGPGGKVTITGAFKSSGVFKDFALKIKGSGTTTVISANITTDSDVFIDDAVQVNAASVTIDTSSKNSKVTITGGDGGIFATKDAVNSLTINAGSGAIDLGSLKGFGDNGGAASFLNNVTLSGGSTTLNASANTIQGDFTLSAGTLSLGASGAIDAKGDILITSTDQVTLTGNTDLLAGSDIQLGGPIDGAFDLHLAADTGDILVSGTVGATTALKTVSITDAKDATFSGAIKAERLTQSAGTGATLIDGAVTASATTGDAISLTTRNIFIFSSGPLATAGGNIVLDADSGQQAGAFTGVSLTGNVTTTGNGNITIAGRGGDDVGGGLYGVVIGLGAKVQAGGTGTVAVTGIGGASSGNFNYGVNITGPGTAITSSGGDVTVAGTGGGSGASKQNYGVILFTGGAISGGGNGTVTVTGTGGASTGNDNDGVYVLGSGSSITSSGGDVTVAGTGGGSAGSTLNDGVYVIGGTISSKGTLSLTGTKGANSGVGLNLVNGTISTASNNTAMTISADTLDINTTDGTITAGTGTVTLQTLTKGTAIDLGTAATATFGLSDAELDRITAGILVVGREDATASGMITVSSALTITPNLSLVSPKGIAVNATLEGSGNLTLDADNGTQQTGNFNGVEINRNVTTTGNGNITISGRGGDDADGLQSGVQVSSSVISAGGTGAVSITGIGGASAGTLNQGVLLIGSESAVSSTSGNVTINGTGGGSGASSFNYGVFLSGLISVGGLGKVSVTGTGGATTGDSNYGVWVYGKGSNITSSGGNVTVTGKGGGSGASSFNYGTYINDAGIISGGGNGKVTVLGTGGPGSGNFNYGVYVGGTESAITSSGGDVFVIGTGGGTGSGIINNGILLADFGTISSLGALTLTGTAGVNASLGLNLTSGTFSTATNNTALTITTDTIDINITNGAITAGTGTVTLRNRTAGTTINLGTASTATFGLSDAQLDRITAGSLVIGREDAGFESGATTVSSALTITPNLILVSPMGITVSATLEGSGNLTLDADNGTQQTGNFIGVNIAQNVTTTGNGNITISGRGGDTSPDNNGVKITKMVQPGGTGTLKVTGTGGAGTGSNNIGVHLRGGFALLTSSGGNVEVIGTGGAGVENNNGILVDLGATIASGKNGNVFVTGSGGNGTNQSNIGVLIDHISTITSGENGNVSVIGTGGKGTINNTGVRLGIQSMINSGSKGAVVVQGTGGAGTGTSNSGVSLGSSSIITSGGGNVQVTGIGATGVATNNNHGISLGNFSQIDSPGTLELIGQAGNGNQSYGVTLPINGTLSTAANNTALTITTDTISISIDDGTIMAGTGTVTLRNLTAGKTIDLGTASASTFGLSDAQLDRITAGTLIIGRQDAGFETGAITVSAYLTLTPSLQLIGPNGINLNGNVSSKGLSLNSNQSLNMQLPSPTAGAGYKQFVTTGVVALTNSKLNLTIPSSFTPANGTEFILIANDGNDPVQGAFQNFSNNQLVTINGINYRFSYHGGDGNDVTLLRPSLQPIVAGTSSSSGGMVQLTLAGDTTPTTFIPFAGFFGEIRVSSEGDFSNDGIFDFVAAAGPSGGPRVTIMDGVTGAVFANFFAYSVAFTGGVFTGTGDVTGDGLPDLVTGAGAGGGPHVIVWDGATLSNPTPTIASQFFAYDQAFSGGVSVAAGDLDGDSFSEIITGAGPGGAPQVNVYASRTFELLNSFLAYAPQFSGGVYVAVGELTGDTRGEIITGADAGGGPQVNVFDSQNFQLLNSFFAYGNEFEGGVRVGALDFTGDAIDDIITGAGPGGGPHVKVLEFDQTLLDQFFAGDPGFTGGVFVS